MSVIRDLLFGRVWPLIATVLWGITYIVITDNVLGTVTWSAGIVGPAVPEYNPGTADLLGYVAGPLGLYTALVLAAGALFTRKSTFSDPHWGRYVTATLTATLLAFVTGGVIIFFLATRDIRGLWFLPAFFVALLPLLGRGVGIPSVAQKPSPVQPVIT